jgi:HEAT repeats
VRIRFAAAAALALVAWATVARADRVDDLAQRLRTDADYKVRLSAALALGKLGDRRAVPALIDGLGDPDKSVRLVAAGALGKLVDAAVAPADRARAVSALTQLAERDPEDSVRVQAQRSIDALRALPTPGGRSVYIEVGNMADKTTRGAAILPVMRQTVATSLQRRAPSYLIHAPGARNMTDDLRRAGPSAFFVDASLTKLDSSGSHVACAVSMILATYPQKSMFGFANGSADVDAGSTSERALSGALGDCVTAVLDDLVETKIVPTIQARSP